MGVYIPNMEMPTSCYKCPFLDYEEGFCFASGVKDEGGLYESTLCPGDIKDGRHDDCPIIEITPHGRLIDADALIAAYGQQKPFIVFGEQIESAPTIIEEEEK